MRIQCPECSQRFDVTEDFLGKTVECGSCDHRFKVTAEEVVRERKKFYPGEKKDSHLERFGRNPASSATNVSFAQAHYQQDVSADVVGPPRPRRKVAMTSGVVLMVVIVLVFLIAGGREGAMRNMETVNRFILCGFFAVLGSALVLYGTPHKRRLGVMLAVVFSVILMILPVLFPANPISTSVAPIELANGSDGGKVVDSQKELENYLFEIGYEPVDEAIRQHPKESVVGIYLRNVNEVMRGKIASYLYNATDKVSRETVYKRGDNGTDGLILLVDQKLTIDEIAALCEKFGRIEKIDKNLRLVDISVESAKISMIDRYKMLDPNSLDFEAQNLKALQSFDPQEQMNAVKRLAGAPPRALRDDITQQLMSMLSVSSEDLQLEIINALKTWALPNSGAGPVVLEAVKGLHAKGKVSINAMELLVDHKVKGGEVILLELWEKNPAVWSETLMKLGEGAEVLLLPKLKEMDVSHVTAAADILGKVGTKATIEYIRGILPEMDEHRKKSLQAAIDEIKKRP